VLRILLVSAIVLHAAVSNAGDATRQRVHYTTRVVRLHGEIARAEACGRPASIRACTHFIAPKLAAISTEDHGRWRIEATGSFIALVGLFDTRLFQHELNHVHDVELAIDSYIAKLERMSFPSVDACESARTEAAQEFTTRVRAFAEESNFRRHGFTSR
jgi:hypothetical protein